MGVVGVRRPCRRRPRPAGRCSSRRRVHVVAPPAALRCRRSFRQPVQLVGSGGSRRLLAGRWQAQPPDPHAATRGTEGPRLDSPAGPADEGCSANPTPLQLRWTATDHGHAVPRFTPATATSYPRGPGDPSTGAGPRFCLLQREHVGSPPGSSASTPWVDPRAQGVDVPRGDPHPFHTSEPGRHGVQPRGGPEAGAPRLIQFALWGVALVAIGGSIAPPTRPHTDALGRYSGDETGFWFGLVIAGIGTLLLLVPVVAWGTQAGTRRLARRRGAPRRSTFADIHPLG